MTRHGERWRASVGPMSGEHSLVREEGQGRPWRGSPVTHVAESLPPHSSGPYMHMCMYASSSRLLENRGRGDGGKARMRRGFALFMESPSARRTRRRPVRRRGRATCCTTQRSALHVGSRRRCCSRSTWPCRRYGNCTTTHTSWDTSWAWSWRTQRSPCGRTSTHCTTWGTSWTERARPMGPRAGRE